MSAKVVELLRRHGRLKRRELEQLMEAEGLVAGNMGQTLAYLKSRGVVEVVERGVYGPGAQPLAGERVSGAAE